MRRLLVLALMLGFVAGCGKNVAVQGPVIKERDKELYDNALKFMEKSRFDAARLELNTLMGVYPDSEYAPRAKYAFAYASYREGGTSGYTEAEIHFKDFITFFPESDLTDDAQLMVAMTHVKQLENPDRDDTQARLAEHELSEMIRMFPDSPLLDEAKAKLRDVQEVLAESIFGPARQYFLRGAYPAVVDRCEEILATYPDFSGTDRVLFHMAESFRRMNDFEGAVTHYAQIVREYPESSRVKDAKKMLVALKSQVPEPDLLAANRAKELAKQKESQGGGLFSFNWLFGGGPSVSTDTGAASVQPNTGVSVDQAK